MTSRCLLSLPSVVGSSVLSGPVRVNAAPSANRAHRAAAAPQKVVGLGRSSLMGRSISPQRPLCNTFVLNRRPLNVRAEANSAAATPDPSKTPAIPSTEVEKKTKYWQVYIFAVMWVGYVVYYFTRGSFTFTAPVLKESLNLSMQDIGRVTSVFPIMYGFSKFASGVLTDAVGARAIFGIGLIISGALNVLFGQFSTLGVLSLVWAANGFFQGFGAPACAKLLTQWYPSNVRGTWWAGWVTANNVGGFTIPLLAGTVTSLYGWRWGMRIPGLIGIVMGVIALLLIRNKPEDVGLPALSDGKAKAKNAAGQELSMTEVMVKYVLKNKAIWALAISYFFVYVVRQGMVSWSHFYVMQQKGFPNAAAAAALVSGLELGGLAGGFFSGVLSDKMEGHRIRVVIGYQIGLLASILAFVLAPAGNAFAIGASVAAVGFFIYGPQMLIGLIGAELSHPMAVATGNGLLGWIAYLGAATAGEPLAILVKNYGWTKFFSFLLGACFIPMLLLAPFWSTRKLK
eukprot:jgi/Mesvir1/21668/Mv04089-RA.1